MPSSTQSLTVLFIYRAYWTLNLFLSDESKQHKYVYMAMCRSEWTAACDATGGKTYANIFVVRRVSILNMFWFCLWWRQSINLLFLKARQLIRICIPLCEEMPAYFFFLLALHLYVAIVVVYKNIETTMLTRSKRPVYMTFLIELKFDNFFWVRRRSRSIQYNDDDDDSRSMRSIWSTWIYMFCFFSFYFSSLFCNGIFSEFWARKRVLSIIFLSRIFLFIFDIVDVVVVVVCVPHQGSSVLWNWCAASMSAIHDRRGYQIVINCHWSRWLWAKNIRRISRLDQISAYALSVCMCFALISARTNDCNHQQYVQIVWIMKIASQFLEKAWKMSKSFECN